MGDAVEARLMAEWAPAAGGEFAAACRPAALRAGRLTVVPAGEAWRYELTMRKAELKERLNSYLGGDHVKEITVMARRARV
jgi:predicted nucleic acid-binding Zn ribbon protein